MSHVTCTQVWSNKSVRMFYFGIEFQNIFLNNTACARAFPGFGDRQEIIVMISPHYFWPTLTLHRKAGARASFGGFLDTGREIKGIVFFKGSFPRKSSICCIVRCSNLYFPSLFFILSPLKPAIRQVHFSIHAKRVAF